MATREFCMATRATPGILQTRAHTPRHKHTRKQKQARRHSRPHPIKKGIHSYTHHMITHTTHTNTQNLNGYLQPINKGRDVKRKATEKERERERERERGEQDQNLARGFMSISQTHQVMR